MHRILIAMMIITLTSCAKTSNRIDYLDLPELPIAGNEVAQELEKVCLEDRCENLNNYFNEMYIFSKIYNIYKEN